MFTPPKRRANETINDYRKRSRNEREKERQKQNRSSKKKKREEQAQKRQRSQFNEQSRVSHVTRREANNNIPSATEYYSKCTFSTHTEVDKTIRLFEKTCQKIKHKHCHTCHRVSTNLKMSKDAHKCQDCKKRGYTQDDVISEGLLPVWFDINKTPQFHIPVELSCLRECEKMLIQMLNTHVPAHHIKFGVIGIKGHVCAFPQDISQVCTELPRLPSSCSVVRYIKETNSRVVGSTSVSLFTVRREVIIRALWWLKQHHIGYKNITINESNLEWMDGESEKELPIPAETTLQNNEEEMEDIGPSPSVNITPRDEADTDIVYNGIISEDSPIIASEEDRSVANALLSANDNGDVFLNWPSIEEKAVSELSEEKIFPLAFPWLFPGGIGDIKDFRKRQELSASEWAERLITYEDARFTIDKIFCFYVMNYCIRRRNRDSGNFFVNRFSSSQGEDMESLCEAIADGKSNYINEISYFSKEIPGSDSYWRFKRDQLHSWINHHVEKGNGMPTYFITLSCADYFWADIMRLVRERHKIATGEEIELSEGEKGRVQLINNHAAVVQEYFQSRVIVWLDTVGKDIFSINHYWVRYEFAPSRGQIHAHMLCISSDQNMHRAMYDLKHDEEKQAAVLAGWAERKFGLSACQPITDETPNVEDETTKINPVAVYYSDVRNKTEDLIQLKDKVEMHKCNGYCMRESSKSDKEKYRMTKGLPK